MAKLNITTQEALNEIRVLIAELENLKKSSVNVNKANADSFNKLETSLKKIREKVGLLANQMNYLQAIVNKSTGAVSNNSSALNANANASNKAANSTNKAASSTNKATAASQKNQKQLQNNTKATNDLDRAFGNLIRTFGVYLSLNFTLDLFKDVYENIKSFDSLSFAIDKITQNTLDYENSQKFLLTLTEKFGVELLSTANRWLKFLAAAKQTGLALRDTENIFRSVTKASAVLGLQTDELQSVYLALEQMLSKGKVTTEELRRQLGERLPGAMGIMAAAIGKTIPELDTMLKKGEVLSADALPKFARALEQAYGIEHQENIRTLTAEQGRLTAAWETFIKNIAEGDGIIKQTLGWMLNAMTRIVKAADYLGMSSPQRVRSIAAAQEEEKRLEIEQQKYLQAVRELGFENEEELNKKISNARIALNKSRNKEEAEAAEAHLNEMLLLQKNANDRKEELLVEYGVNSVDMFEKMYQKQLATYNKYQEEMAKPNVTRNLTFSGWEEIREPGVQYRDQEFVDSINIKELEKELGLMEAMYNLSRKFAETSKVKLLDDGEVEKTRKVWIELKNLNEVYDLTREIQMKIVQSNIDSNQKIIDSEKSTNASRIKLYEENNKYRIRLAEIAYEAEAEKARIYRDKEIAALELYNRKVQKSNRYTPDDKLESEKRTREQIELLNKEYNQKEIIAYQNKNDKIFASNTKLEKDLIKNLKEANAVKLSIVEDPYNLEVIAAKKVYEESKKTTRDKIRLEKELERISLESAEAIIRAQIAILRASIDTSKQSSEHIDGIIREINKLEASINNLKPKNKEEWFDFWNTILGLAAQYNNALGDLVDAGFERRIEGINAEIDAETKKYQKLHELAEGDALQQETLRVQKERRIEQLEKKRLKEEQKQAKAKKAFALASIAIDTAAAIMRAWVNPGFPGAVPLTVAIGALGLVQSAAVLAAPIPQYKDGGKITKDEIAMINDGNAQEYVKRGNKVLTTETKDAIVQLKRGDTVYKNYDEMIKYNNSIPNMQGSNYISENDFNKLLTTVSSGIEKGFKKANINNKIVVKSNSSEYRDSLSIWS